MISYNKFANYLLNESSGFKHFLIQNRNSCRQVEKYSPYVLIIIIFMVSACQESVNYNNFLDSTNKGIVLFKLDLKSCQSYGQLHSKRSEGSQGSGERLLLKRNLVLSCMRNKQRTMKKS